MSRKAFSGKRSPVLPAPGGVSREVASLLKLAETLARDGKLGDAHAALERVVAAHPRVAAAHAALGRVALQAADGARAMDCFVRAVELEPETVAHHHGLCSSLMLQGQFAQAAEHLTQVVALKPDYLDGLVLLANAHLGSGEPQRALAVARRAFAISDTPPVRGVLANAMRSLAALPNDSDMQAILVRAISEPWDRPIQFAGHAIALLRSDPQIGAWLARLTAANEAIPESEDVLAVLSRNAVLIALLENTLAADIGLERLLSQARCRLLRAVAAGEPVQGARLVFACALARQCFINEYVFASSDEERALCDRLAAQPPSPAALAVLAAYRPLHTLPSAGKLLGQSWPPAVQGLLVQQVREVATERDLARTMPQLTPIDDDISQRVREQYEQNPYPRWVKPWPARRPSTIDQFMRLTFPHPGVPFRPLGKTGGLDILVAGCGTGQQIFDLAHRLANPRILAIDLSLASLAFAKRQVEAAKLRNVEIGQADILRLRDLNRTFDVIDCGGVLHHLGDPLAGWRVLVDLLRPNGLMHIALYSERARSGIVTAQRRAVAEGYDASPDGIRRFRATLMAEAATSSPLDPARNGDFFTLSTCRDLLFHVQEHRFTLEAIAAFLAEAGLTFVGMDATAEHRKRCAARFPADPSLTDLANWDRYERENPMTFINMYQFWVQKAAA
jgi:SAM-dependent methyltransferase/tetratricopeptide (TPR) repeat protein